MNILEILNENNVSMDIRHYGVDDMSTNIKVKQLLENKDIILNHFKTNDIKILNNYIDYVFLEIIMNFYEIIPYMIEDKEAFSNFLDKCKQAYEGYKVKDVVFFINEHYIDIYSYEDAVEKNLYLAHDLKDYTSDLIGLHFNSFDTNVIDYVINEATYDVIDSFEKWQKYFIKHPNELDKLFSENNINKVFYMRFEEIANILESIKSNSKFSKTISNSIDIIYKIVKDNYFYPKEDLAIWQSYYMINDCMIFLKKMKSTYVYELEKELVKQEEVFNNNLVKNGHSSTFEYDMKPFINFFENKNNPWEIRIIYLTHSKDKQNKLVSFLEQGAKSETKALTDELARSNPGTDEYFTSWRLRNLSLYSFEIKSRLMSIMRTDKNLSEYISDIYGELKYICTNIDTTMELEGLDENIEMLSQYLTDLFINLLSDDASLKMTTKNTIYGCSMFVCGLIEKTLRIIYKYNMRNISYIPDSNITLGNLLNECDNNSSIILDILGKEQIKCLRYYLHKVDFYSVGDNIRNDLAHLNGRTIKKLNYDLILELLSYFNSILNSCVLYYQRKILQVSNP